MSLKFARKVNHTCYSGQTAIYGSISETSITLSIAKKLKTQNEQKRFFMKSKASLSCSYHIKRDYPDNYTRSEVSQEEILIFPMSFGYEFELRKEVAFGVSRARNFVKDSKSKGFGIEDKVIGASPLSQVQGLPRNQLAQEITNNMKMFPDNILLTRVGQFYESYFGQAKVVSELLQIKLTHRVWDGQRIWMCGFPIHHLDKYLRVLVKEHHRSVALCEEFPININIRDMAIKQEFKRRVTRIVTPGTLIDESFLDTNDCNYLLAISIAQAPEDINAMRDGPVGLAWIDVSTGEFRTDETTVGYIRDYLVRINPREVVLIDSFKESPTNMVRLMLEEEGIPIAYTASSRDMLMMPESFNWENGIRPTNISYLNSVRQSGLTILQKEAIHLMVRFLQENLLDFMPSLPSPMSDSHVRRMQIDSNTIKSLEIRECAGRDAGSLFSFLNRTMTSGGTRMLMIWICSPSVSLEEIRNRHCVVEFFYSRPHLRHDIRILLKETDDAIRILQKFMLNRGGLDDLVALKRTLEAWNLIEKRITMDCSEEANAVLDSGRHHLKDFLGKFSCFPTILDKITATVIENKDLYQSSTDLKVDLEGSSVDVSGIQTTDSLGNSRNDRQPRWAIKSQYSTRLLSYHQRLIELRLAADELEKRFRQELNDPSLTLRSSPQHGIHVHSASPKRASPRQNNSPNFILIAGNNNRKIYFNQSWSILGNEINDVISKIFVEEKEAFNDLRAQVIEDGCNIRSNALIIDELDILAAFASLATETNLVKPMMTDGLSLRISNGRHPTVELALHKEGRSFTPNSLILDAPRRMHIITGPNMGGKSTFLRQTALICLLAQMGSFVPADEAELGVVDRIFTRIGARDDIVRDRSTFMVEMIETAEILKNASNRSLVIMDEVGRGTTVRDGIALAFATIHHLLIHNCCRTLFATHFHELADMLGYIGTDLPSSIVEFMHTGVDEISEYEFTYSYNMRRGVNRDGHGLKTAYLAGVPLSALNVAKSTSDWLMTQVNFKSGEGSRVGHFGKDFIELP